MLAQDLLENELFRPALDPQRLQGDMEAARHLAQAHQPHHRRRAFDGVGQPQGLIKFRRGWLAGKIGVNASPNLR